MPGFKNAPHIDYYAVGMRVSTSKIVHVCDGGAALCSNGVWLYKHDRRTMTLDLDSIWVGRKYTGLYGVTRKNEFTVIVIGNGLIILRPRFGIGIRAEREDDLRATYRPIDLNSEDSQPEPWKPEVGKECMWLDNRVTVLGLHKGDAWVCRDALANGKPTFCLPQDRLSPLPSPPEPEFKVGDYVEVRYKDGRVKDVGTIDRMWSNDNGMWWFKLEGGDCDRAFENWIVTRLVPETAK